MKQIPANANRLALPLIAIVGRPNVGKSTLFNRLTGSRRAIVGDEPGITRDRLYGNAEWRGRDFRVVDTGGIIPEEKDLIPAEIFRQARVALNEAAAIVMLVDARTELAAPDLELARLLLRTGKPLFLAVNKVDTDKQSPLVGEFHGLGIRNVFPVSAENGRGLDDLLDAVLAVLPVQTRISTTEDTEATEEIAEERLENREPQMANSEQRIASSERRTTNDERPADHDSLPDDRRLMTDDGTPTEINVAIIGHPNVGKSTLLNRLTGSERAIVSPIPGTTRDAVDEVVEYHGRQLRFIDTAGIRRKGKTRLMAEKLSVVLSRKHLEASDIALFMVDATEGVSALDSTIAGYAHESGCSVIIVVNKWDLVASGEKRAISQSKTARIQDSERPRRGPGNGVPRRPGFGRLGWENGVPIARGVRAMGWKTTRFWPSGVEDRSVYEQRLRNGLKFLSYAPVVFISAHTGKGVEKILPLIEQVAAERRKRISTGEMNRFLKSVDFDRASVPASKRVKIYYMTQAAVAPPTFILFTDRAVKLHFSYERFIENQIRRAFGFVGTPIWIKNRASE